jgi:hypothetical protein
MGLEARTMISEIGLPPRPHQVRYSLRSVRRLAPIGLRPRRHPQLPRQFRPNRSEFARPCAFTLRVYVLSRGRSSQAKRARDMNSFTEKRGFTTVSGVNDQRSIARPPVTPSSNGPTGAQGPNGIEPWPPVAPSPGPTGPSIATVVPSWPLTCMRWPK